MYYIGLLELLYNVFTFLKVNLSLPKRKTTSISMSLCSKTRFRFKFHCHHKSRSSRRLVNLSREMHFSRKRLGRIDFCKKYFTIRLLTATARCQCEKKKSVYTTLSVMTPHTSFKPV